MPQLYSDRNKPPQPRTRLEMDLRTQKAFAGLINNQISNKALGATFPEICPDNDTPCGTDETKALNVLVGVVPAMQALDTYTNLPGPYLDGTDDITTSDFFDALEWCAARVGYPQERGKYHDYYNHAHYSWDKAEGLSRFRDEVNLLLARNHLAYEMDDEGQIHRTAIGPVAQTLQATTFSTGNSEADNLLERARELFFERDANAGQDALEKLWDAFERIKTLNDPDKKESIAKLLKNVSGTERELLNTEMKALTAIGNQWCIRHHETDKFDLGEGRKLRDYFFLRMFTLLQHLLS